MIMVPIQFIASFIVLTICGTVNAAYLVWKHSQKKTLMCPLNHDCSVVTESRWSHLFYFRNETLGLVFFIAMLGLILSTLTVHGQTEILYLLILAACGGALLFSIFLVLLQKFVIEDYCFYCLVSAVITLLLFLNSILLWTNK